MFLSFLPNIQKANNVRSDAKIASCMIVLIGLKKRRSAPCGTAPKLN